MIEHEEELLIFVPYLQERKRKLNKMRDQDGELSMLVIYKQYIDKETHVSTGFFFVLKSQNDVNDVFSTAPSRCSRKPAERHLCTEYAETFGSPFLRGKPSLTKASAALHICARNVHGVYIYKPN